MQNIHKGPFIDEIFFLVLAAPIALFLVIWIGRLDLSDQPKLIEPISVLGPFNAIISIINFFGKFYFAYGHGRFWSSCWAFVSVRSLERLSAPGATKNQVAFQAPRTQRWCGVRETWRNKVDEPEQIRLMVLEHCSLRQPL